MSIDAISWAFKQTISPAAKKLVLLSLADNADDHGICFPSYNTIAEKTGLTRRAVIKNCKALVEEGFIQKSGRNRGNQSTTSNAYLLPIREGCIEDHPLSCLFTEGSETCSPPLVNDVHHPSEPCSPPLVNDVHHLVNHVHPPSEPRSPLEPSINHQLTKERERALTRQEFLRGIDRGFQDSCFDTEDFGHLTETEIKNQAAECWDRWGGNLKGRDPVIILRSWMRKGQDIGTIRKPPKNSDHKNANQVEQTAEPENPLQDWHERIKPVVGEKEFISWIRRLHWDGNGAVHAPTKFHADYVRDRFYSDITKILHDGVKIIHHPYQQEKERENE